MEFSVLHTDCGFHLVYLRKAAAKILWEMPLNVSDPKVQRCCWSWFQDLPQQVLLSAMQKGLGELGQDWQREYQISQKMSDGQSTILCSPEELGMSATACSKEKSGEKGNSSPSGLVFSSRTEVMEAHTPRKLLWGLTFISSCFPRPPICPSCKAHMTGWLSWLVGKTRRLWDRLMEAIVLLQGPVEHTLWEMDSLSFYRICGEKKWHFPKFLPLRIILNFNPV